jgi:hypothetical protein
VIWFVIVLAILIIGVLIMKAILQNQGQLGMFVAVAYGGVDYIMTSPDGITWTARTPSSDSYWRSVCWSPELSLFVAVAYEGTDSIMTSPDGITWTARTSPSNSLWHSVVWAA